MFSLCCKVGLAGLETSIDKREEGIKQKRETESYGSAQLPKTKEEKRYWEVM